jgi:hypothetical protein
MKNRTNNTQGGRSSSVGSGSGSKSSDRRSSEISQDSGSTGQTCPSDQEVTSDEEEEE